MAETKKMTKLIDRISESGIKITFLAEQLGLSRMAFYNKLNGISEFTTSEVKKLCELLGINDLSDKERIFF